MDRVSGAPGVTVVLRSIDLPLIRPGRVAFGHASTAHRRTTCDAIDSQVDTERLTCRLCSEYSRVLLR